jgi:uncharacterized protein HemY
MYDNTIIENLFREAAREAQNVKLKSWKKNCSHSDRTNFPISLNPG